MIGWLASIFMGTNNQQGILLNVVVGIVGAMPGGWLISPLVGAGTINQADFSLPADLNVAHRGQQSLGQRTIVSGNFCLTLGPASNNRHA